MHVAPIYVRPPNYRPLQHTRAGELQINPKQSENEWHRWLEGIQDWCISRQLWWGHRCPAYFVNIEGQEQDVSEVKVGSYEGRALLTTCVAQ